MSFFRTLHKKLHFLKTIPAAVEYIPLLWSFRSGKAAAPSPYVQVFYTVQIHFHQTLSSDKTHLHRQPPPHQMLRSDFFDVYRDNPIAHRSLLYRHLRFPALWYSDRYALFFCAVHPSVHGLRRKHDPTVETHDFHVQFSSSVQVLQNNPSVHDYQKYKLHCKGILHFS